MLLIWLSICQFFCSCPLSVLVFNNLPTVPWAERCCRGLHKRCSSQTHVRPKSEKYYAFYDPQQNIHIKSSTLNVTIICKKKYWSVYPLSVSLMHQGDGEAWVNPSWLQMIGGVGHELLTSLSLPNTGTNSYSHTCSHLWAIYSSQLTWYTWYTHSGKISVEQQDGTQNLLVLVFEDWRLSPIEWIFWIFPAAHPDDETTAHSSLPGTYSIIH